MQPTRLIRTETSRPVETLSPDRVDRTKSPCRITLTTSRRTATAMSSRQRTLLMPRRNPTDILERQRRFNYPGQRFSEWEKDIVRLGWQAGWSDASIGRWLGRSEQCVIFHRKRSGAKRLCLKSPARLVHA